jgi:hypothetical protein
MAGGKAPLVVYKRKAKKAIFQNFFSAIVNSNNGFLSIK